MNPSTAAVAEAQKSARMVSFAELSQLFKEKALYPSDGQAHEISGTNFVHLFALSSYQQVEERINDLVIVIKNAGTKELRASEMEQPVAIAASSKSAFELHYLASMFIHHREVMRAVARNTAIEEKTQMILASDDVLKKDRGVQLALANNPALTHSVMTKVLNESIDPFVHHGIALNAANKSQLSKETVSYFSLICEELAKSYDSAVRQAAIPGIKDPHILREFSENNSVFLVPGEMEAVARNRHTPDDVLADLSKSSLSTVQSFLSIKVAQYARSTLESKRYEAGHNAALPSPAI